MLILGVYRCSLQTKLLAALVIMMITMITALRLQIPIPIQTHTRTQTNSKTHKRRWGIRMSICTRQLNDHSLSHSLSVLYLYHRVPYAPERTSERIPWLRTMRIAVDHCAVHAEFTNCWLQRDGCYEIYVRNARMLCSANVCIICIEPM